MKRVGIYLGFPPEGGGAFQYAQSVLSALSALPSTQYRIVVAYSHPAWASRLDGCDAQVERIWVHEGLLDSAIRAGLRFGFPLSLWRLMAPAIHPLTRCLRHATCDLWVFPAQDVWTYAIPVPALGVVHDLMHRYESRFPEVSAFGLYQRRERHYRRLCRHTRGVLVDSEVGRRQLIESYHPPPGRVHVLPYVAPAYMQVEATPAGFDERYRLPERFIFYPAQFWEHKNHVRLLEALAMLRPELPDLHLVFVGSAKNAYRRVLETIDRHGLADRVKILGYVPDEDMPEFYRRALALIMPTFFGPTNIPPLEAMVAGCPMAISAIYGMPEQVGDAALLFDPGSVEGIAEAMRKLATDDALRRRLAAAGREHAGRWAQPQFGGRLAEIIDTVLQQ
ncbi:glycosyltransferase family 4 protein [Caldichromatium japonicum]|uniref:Glycosyltransferase family 4 protein n=1 Tax=Caldichromatium japonicum TaxID=2699430 RepID=A0A6G7VAQ5_9GAMM|nr:glycosyltransferase family 1 protein [Caldichromatium japonicum]QIK36955.1 glycosyltransferase family 4 protein [Caldichromatium japonicum]